ncbi:MAG: hypothetical protein WKF34_10130 [Pyrinomonadaceae bacterium]
MSREFGEPFGVAIKDGEIFVSDGANGKIWRFNDGEPPVVFAEGFHTPSAISFAPDGRLFVADSGTHSIKSVGRNGDISHIAGIENQSGFADGTAGDALFLAPIGVAVAADGTAYVADSYNDRIRVISESSVTTLAGGRRGFVDGQGETAQFDTPSGIALWNGKLLIADTGNHRVRLVELDGRVTTLSGNSSENAADGLLASAAFYQPTAIAADAESGSIYITDGNVIRQISASPIPFVLSISDRRRGLADGPSIGSRFNRPSGLAVDTSGRLVIADAENRLIRRYELDDTNSAKTEAANLDAMSEPIEEFRHAAPGRWPFDPPNVRRDIAGTMGEIRGAVNADSEEPRFHNGLDIAGDYGETARFIRDETVLLPLASDNFGTLRELLRMPALGYIHIRLGRNAVSQPFNDKRFLFDKDERGQLKDLRVPRGARFSAGEAIGTLNSMNHVHLVAGRAGRETNALGALVLPGIGDTRSPVIEKVTISDGDGNPIETTTPNGRIRVTGRFRITVRAYDQMDGNSERRRLGVYRVGYQVLDRTGMAIAEPNWTISFERLPAASEVGSIYAVGSSSGPTGETVFNYLATRDGFADLPAAGTGEHSIRVLVGDYFGNVSKKDVEILFE